MVVDRSPVTIYLLHHVQYVVWHPLVPKGLKEQCMVRAWEGLGNVQQHDIQGGGVETKLRVPAYSFFSGGGTPEGGGYKKIRAKFFWTPKRGIS